MWSLASAVSSPQLTLRIYRHLRSKYPRKTHLWVQQVLNNNKCTLVLDSDSDAGCFSVARFRLRQAAFVGAGKHKVNTSSLRRTAGSATPCRKRTLTTGMNNKMSYSFLEICSDVLIRVRSSFWTFNPSFSHVFPQSFDELSRTCCTLLVRQASLLSRHQDQVVQRPDPPRGGERSRSPAGSVHGQRQDQDVTRAKPNHPAPAEEQRRELAQSEWWFKRSVLIKRGHMYQPNRQYARRKEKKIFIHLGLFW